MVCLSLLRATTAIAQEPAAARSGLATSLLRARDNAERVRLLGDFPGLVDDTLFELCRASAQGALDQRESVRAAREFEAALAVAVRLGSAREQAIALRGVGVANYRMEQNVAAAQAYARGLPLATAAGERSLEADLLRGLGLTARAQGHMGDAIAWYQQSIALSRQMGDPRALASALSNLGVVYRLTGDLRQAGTLLEEARQAAVGMPDVVDRLINNLGTVAAEQGNHEAAKDYFEQSLRAALASKTSTASSWSNLGLVYIGIGETAKALEMHGKAIEAARAAHDQGAEAIGLLNRAELELRLKREGAARTDLGTALGLSMQGDTRFTTGNILAAFATLELAAGNIVAASEYGNRALQIAQQYGSGALESHAAGIIGESWRLRGQAAKAREWFEKSIAGIESIRNLAGGDEQTGLGFLAGRMQPYQGLLRLLMEQKEPALALQVAERAKARQLLDVVRRGKTQPEASMTETERREELRLAEEIARLSQARGQTALARASTAMETFRVELYTRHPELAARRGEAAPVTAAQAVELLPDTHTAIVEFATLPEATFLIVLTRGADGTPRVESKIIRVRQEDLAREVNDFREDLAKRSLGYRARAASLYQRFFDGIPGLATATTWLLVPDGPLWNLPFQALVRPDGSYLLEHQAVFYAPSLTFLLERRQQQAPPARKYLLALGDPSKASLPEAAREVTELMRTYGAANSVALTGEDAAKQTWIAQAPDFRVLHIATHGVLNPANPMYSWLQMAGTAEVMEARDIVRMNLHADVAVLSACDTARGVVSLGEGLVGMSWAFLVGGVASTVVSQWAVDSGPTSRMMTAFHQRLKPVLDVPGGRGRSRALQQAALGMLHTPGYQHPYYWAGFVMIGDGF